MQLQKKRWATTEEKERESGTWGAGDSQYCLHLPPLAGWDENSYNLIQ